jgi:hypothetical protein
MKARRVKGLDREGTLADNAERIVAVRLDELCSFVPRALDPDEVTTLHDMRIAAKRLRYVLEVTSPCFGPYAVTAAKKAKELQDLLGELHDCDVLVPRLGRLLRELETEDVAAREQRHAASWRGLHALIIRTRIRREELFRDFLAMWTDLERAGFRARLEYAIAERTARAA